MIHDYVRVINFLLLLLLLLIIIIFNEMSEAREKIT